MFYQSILFSIIQFFFEVFVLFPYSALTIPRQHHIPQLSSGEEASQRLEREIMVSEKVYRLCTQRDSVSAYLANNPAAAPHEAWNHLYGHERNSDDGEHAEKQANGQNTSDALQRAQECGSWGATQPSKLFLQVSEWPDWMYHFWYCQIYNDALGALDHDIGCGMVSPSLMGSHGVIPLTVISVWVLHLRPAL